MRRQAAVAAGLRALGEALRAVPDDGRDHCRRVGNGCVLMLGSTSLGRLAVAARALRDFSLGLETMCPTCGAHRLRADATLDGRPTRDRRSFLYWFDVAVICSCGWSGPTHPRGISVRKFKRHATSSAPSKRLH